MGFADGLMEVRRLVVGIQSGHVGPLFDQDKYFRIARVLQNLLADAAGFLARLRSKLENDSSDLRNRFGLRHDLDHNSHRIAHGHPLTNPKAATNMRVPPIRLSTRYYWLALRNSAARSFTAASCDSPTQSVHASGSTKGCGSPCLRDGSFCDRSSTPPPG